MRADLGRTRTGPLDPRRPGGRSHALAGIVRNPLAYPRVNGETRRALVPRFPYAISRRKDTLH